MNVFYSLYICSGCGRKIVLPENAPVPADHCGSCKEELDFITTATLEQLKLEH